MEERILDRPPAVADSPDRFATGKGVRLAAGDAGVPERLAARAYLYTLFQRLFSEEPDESLAEAVDAELAREAFALMGGTAPDAEAFEAVAVSLENTSDCRAEYTRLFIGPGTLPVPPWESVWKLKDRSLFTRVTLEVRAAYRAQGFIPERYPQVSDDHLALELDFLVQLALSMQQAWDKGDAEAFERARHASASFLGEHLGTWVEPFAADLASTCQSPYAAAARLLERITRLDAPFLNALSSVLKGERI